MKLKAYVTSHRDSILLQGDVESLLHLVDESVQAQGVLELLDVEWHGYSLLGGGRRRGCRRGNGHGDRTGLTRHRHLESSFRGLAAC